MELFLTLLSGIAWTVVYLEAIRVGFRDRTYAMPVAALGLNIAWESIYGARALATALSAQGVINIIWALVDLVLVYTSYCARTLSTAPPWAMGSESNALS